MLWHQHKHCRISDNQQQKDTAEQKWTKTITVGKSTHDRHPEKVGSTYKEGHDQAVHARQMEFRTSERRRVSCDHVEGNRSHCDHEGSNQNNAPVLRQGTQNFRAGWMMFTSSKFIGFRQGFPQSKEKRNYSAA